MGPSEESLTPSVVFIVVGVGLLTVGIATHFEVSLAGAPFEPIPLVGGLILGAALANLAYRLRPEPEPEPLVPAHVAFMGRMTREPVPDHQALIPVPTHGSSELDENARRMHNLEDEIREISKKINRASIMLATGRLSQAGYRTVVDELKVKRGRLEADRVADELRR